MAHCVETLICLFAVVFALLGDRQFVIFFFFLFDLSLEQTGTTETALHCSSHQQMCSGNPDQGADYSSGIIIIVVVVI